MAKKPETKPNVFAIALDAAPDSPPPQRGEPVVALVPKNKGGRPKLEGPPKTQRVQFQLDVETDTELRVLLAQRREKIQDHFESYVRELLKGKR